MRNADTFTMADLATARKKRRMQKRRKPPVRQVHTGKRYVAFQPGRKYSLLRMGTKRFSTRGDIENVFPLDEKVLFHFVHQDPWVSRDDVEPRYVGVFAMTDGTFVHPHQNHLKLMYENGGRTEISRASSLLEDGTPYWVDVYRRRKTKKLK